MMIWARVLAYITGTVDQELLLRNEYLAVLRMIILEGMKPVVIGLAIGVTGQCSWDAWWPSWSLA